MPQATLVSPSRRYEASFREAVREMRLEGRQRDVDLATLDFDRLLAQFEAERRGENVPPGRVPQTTLWLEFEGNYLGRVAIRHSLNEHLLLVGGHIGYDIRPSARRRGYGTLALQLALPKAHELGLERVLVTCDEGNVGSRRIIERNGGVLENVVENAGVRKLRFWVETRNR